MIVLVLISIVMSQAQDDIYENLIDWLGNDNDVSKIKIQELSPGQRIIVANQDLKAGEEFISINKSFIISQEFVKNESLINKEIIEKGLQINRTLIYTLMFMLEESTNPLSSWRPYLNTLPQYFDDFPQLYQDDFLNLLKGHGIYDYIQEDKNEWTAEYNLLQSNSEVFRAGNYSYDEYVYWRLVLMSRAFNIIGGDALIPFADMLNDHPNGFVRGHFTDTHFVMQVIKDVKKGQEILFRYVYEGNEYYLLHYGYVSEDNYDNTFEFYQCLERSDPLYKAKFKMFQNYDCLAGILVNQTKFQDGILSAARLSVASSIEELLEIQLQQTTAFDAQRVQFISIKNEGLAITNLITVFQDTILKLSTTIEEDQRIIDNPNQHYVRKYIAIYTKLQKLVLQQTIDDLTYIKHLIDNSIYVLICIIQDLNEEAKSTQFHRIKDYYTKVIVSKVIHEDL